MELLVARSRPEATHSSITGMGKRSQSHADQCSVLCYVPARMHAHNTRPATFSLHKLHASGRQGLEHTVCGVRSVVMFCFVFFRKFRLLIELLIAAVSSPAADLRCQKIFTKHHDWADADAPECTCMPKWFRAVFPSTARYFAAKSTPRLRGKAFLRESLNG